MAAALDIRRKDQLAKAYLEDYVKAHPITDAEIQAAYDKAKSEAVEPEYRARHILVTTEAEAKKLIADLGKKAKFEDLAKKYSKDPGSAQKWRCAGLVKPGCLCKGILRCAGWIEERRDHQNASEITIWISHHPSRRHAQTANPSA